MYRSGGSRSHRAGQEPIGADPSAFIDTLGSAIAAILEHGRPHDIAVALDDAVRAAAFVGLVRIECGVDPAEDDPRATGPRFRADRVPAQGVAGVNPDPDNIASLDPCEIDRIDCFINEGWLAE